MPEPIRNDIVQSKAWCSYFQGNSLNAEDMPWHDAYLLTGRERAAVEKSIQQFQLGEGSNGERLLKRGRAYSRGARDPDFVTALGLFIKEEQRHSEYLSHFMRLQSIPRLESHWVDTAFRRLRGLAGLELSLRVLVTAEIIAVPFYRALREATGSPLLQAISARILQDEAAHLRYQSSMLARLDQGRPRLWRRLLGALHSLFLLGTLVLVWVGHRRVFVASNYSFRRFKEETFWEFHPLNDSTRALVACPIFQCTRVPNSSRGRATEPGASD